MPTPGRCTWGFRAGVFGGGRRLRHGRLRARQASSTRSTSARGGGHARAPRSPRIPSRAAAAASASASRFCHARSPASISRLLSATRAPRVALALGGRLRRRVAARARRSPRLRRAAAGVVSVGARRAKLSRGRLGRAPGLRARRFELVRLARAPDRGARRARSSASLASVSAGERLAPRAFFAFRLQTRGGASRARRARREVSSSAAPRAQTGARVLFLQNRRNRHCVFFGRGASEPSPRACSAATRAVRPPPRRAPSRLGAARARARATLAPRRLFPGARLRHRRRLRRLRLEACPVPRLARLDALAQCLDLAAQRLLRLGGGGARRRARRGGARAAPAPPRSAPRTSPRARPPPRRALAPRQHRLRPRAAKARGRRRARASRARSAARMPGAAFDGAIFFVRDAVLSVASSSILPEPRRPAARRGPRPSPSRSRSLTAGLVQRRGRERAVRKDGAPRRRRRRGRRTSTRRASSSVASVARRVVAYVPFGRICRVVRTRLGASRHRRVPGRRRPSSGPARASGGPPVRASRETRRLRRRAAEVLKTARCGDRRALAGQLPATRAWRTRVVSRRAHPARAWTSVARVRARAALAHAVVARRRRGSRTPRARRRAIKRIARTTRKLAKARRAQRSSACASMPASATARASSSSSRAALSSRPRRAASEGGAGGAPFSTKGARGKDADCPRFGSARGTTRPREGIGPSVAPKPTSTRGASSSRACPSRWTRPSIASHAHSTRRRRGVMRRPNVVLFPDKRCLFLKQTLFVSQTNVSSRLLPGVGKSASVVCLGAGGSSNARVVSGVIFGKRVYLPVFQTTCPLYNFDIERGF